ncbi:MAG: FtsQ-type POTRA domain-containing protein [Deltaproteobacteria bacterium]|nr:FtsQ-type POTRA domain-containing protein [Deltaproteobacteria bacterium]
MRIVKTSKRLIVMLWQRRKINRKWHTQPQLYKGRMFYLKQVAHVSMMLVVFVAVVSLFLFFRNSDALNITRVDVLGDLNHATRADIIKLSGITESSKLFVLNLNSVREKIKKLGWVKDVRVRREFPGTIQIYITERKPVAMLLLDTLFFMDDDAVVFKRVESGEVVDVPVITGFKSLEMKKYPHLIKTYLGFCLSFLKFVETQDFYKQESISEIHFNRVSGMTVYTKETGMEIFYGRDQFVQKQKDLEKFRQSKQYGTNAFVRLDLDTIGRIVARKL